jgi:hypothetical protein
MTERTSIKREPSIDPTSESDLEIDVDASPAPDCLPLAEDGSESDLEAKSDLEVSLTAGAFQSTKSQSTLNQSGNAFDQHLERGTEILDETEAIDTANPKQPRQPKWTTLEDGSQSQIFECTLCRKLLPSADLLTEHCQQVHTLDARLRKSVPLSCAPTHSSFHVRLRFLLLSPS